MSKLTSALHNGDVQEAQELVGTLIAEDANPWQRSDVRDYCQVRWTSRFLTSSVQDETALSAAGSRSADDARDALRHRFFVEPNLDIPLHDAPPERVETDVTFLFVPGMLNGLLPVRAFVPAMEVIAAQSGIRFLRADVHPVAAPEANAVDIARAVEEGAGLNSAGVEISEAHRRPVEGRFVLMGYSKGMVDIAAFLVKYPVLAKRVVAVVSWAGANGGADAANGMSTDFLSMVSDGDNEYVRAMLHGLGQIPLPGNYRPFRRVEEARPGDCVLALRTATRDAFWAENGATLDGWAFRSSFLQGPKLRPTCLGSSSRTVWVCNLALATTTCSSRVRRPMCPSRTAWRCRCCTVTTGICRIPRSRSRGVVAPVTSPTRFPRLPRSARTLGFWRTSASGSGEQVAGQDRMRA